MKTLTDQVTEKVDQLLVVLDRDAAHIKQCLTDLNKLRACLVKRDSEALTGLLEAIRLRADDYGSNELRRQAIRRELASLLAVAPEQLNLSVLASRVGADAAVALQRRRQRLVELTGLLRKEYQNTALLLRHFEKLNRSLLDVIFGRGRRGSLVYDSTGRAKPQAGENLMNLHI